MTDTPRTFTEAAPNDARVTIFETEATERTVVSETADGFSITYEHRSDENSEWRPWHDSGASLTADQFDAVVLRKNAKLLDEIDHLRAERDRLAGEVETLRAERQDAVCDDCGERGHLSSYVECGAARCCKCATEYFRQELAEASASLASAHALMREVADGAAKLRNELYDDSQQAPVDSPLQDACERAVVTLAALVMRLRAGTEGK